MVRLKHRYFVLELLAPGERKHQRLGISEDGLYRAVTQAVVEIHGDCGVAAVRSRLIVKYCSAVTRVAILRVLHSAHKLLATALPFVTSLDGQPITLRTIYAGATIMHCFKFLKRHQESRLEELWSRLEPAQRETMKEAIMTLKMPNTAETRALPGVAS